MIVCKALNRREKRTPGYSKNNPDIGRNIGARGQISKGGAPRGLHGGICDIERYLHRRNPSS